MSKKRKRKTKSKNKKKYIFSLLLMLALLLILIFMKSCSSSSHSDTKIIGYLPSWYYQCYTDVDFADLTHINIAFVNPDSDGNMSCSIPDKELKKIIRKAHHHKVKVIAALGGGGGYAHYTELTSDRTSIKSFDDKIMEYINEYSFDGIDLNIEGDVESDFWNNYDIWVKDLAKKCRKNNLILSCAVASWFDSYIDEKTLERFDFISVMAYDNRGSSENHSTYEYAQSCLSYFENDRNIDRNKLVLGIPFYGYRYNADGTCTGKVVTYKEVATYNKDSEYDDISGTCRYNGISTVSKKALLGADYGGVMVWALGQDMTGKTSLLKAISDTLEK